MSIREELALVEELRSIIRAHHVTRTSIDKVAGTGRRLHQGDEAAARALLPLIEAHAAEREAAAMERCKAAVVGSNADMQPIAQACAAAIRQTATKGEGH